MAEDSRRGWPAAAAVLLGLVVLSMFRRWEPGGEAWASWFFARLFSETGELAAPSRYPIYALYLNVFRRLGFPLALHVEYVVTTFAAAAALAAFLKPRAGLWTAVLGAAVWIPFMEVASPPSQKLGLACALLGLMLRAAPYTARPLLAPSYACFLLAYLFRPNFLMIGAPFSLWDGGRLLIGLTERRRLERPALLPLLPLLAVLALTYWFKTAPRRHPWNNGLESTATWAPADLKNLGNAAILSAVEVLYIEKVDGSFRDTDWYFTNRRIWGENGNSLVGALKAKPKIIVTHILRNTADLFPAILARTMLYPVYHALSGPPKWVSEWRLVLRQGQWSHLLPALQGLLAHAAAPLLALALILGALAAVEDADTRLFIFGCALAIAPVILVSPHDRYLFPAIPVLLLSAGWFGRALAARVKSSGVWAVPLCVVLLSNAAWWTETAAALAADAKAGRFPVMVSAENSLFAARGELESLTASCRGVMSLENMFFAGFTRVPLSNIRDVLEIPPFGRYGGGDYAGLSPETADCLFISPDLSTGYGAPLNHHPRYRDYIKPYAEALRAAGARVVPIAGGELILAAKP